MGFNKASGLEATQSAIDLRAANIAAGSAAGFSRADQAFNVIMTGSGTAKAMASGMTTVSRGTMYSKGTIVQTNVATDLAIDGEGLFPAFDSSGNVVYSAKGDWRVVESGDYKNSSNCRLLAWKLNKDGTLPTNSNVVSSLVPVNLSDIASEAKASTKIDLGFNLQISQKAISGAGEVAVLATQGINKGTGVNDIIAPDSGAWGSIRVGDKFSLRSSEAQTASDFTYGGFASTYKPADISVYGATNENQAFTFAASGASHNVAPFNAGNAPNLLDGDGLRISVNGEQDLIFTARQSVTDSLSFNSLTTLAQQINKTGIITATINNGRLYIAAKDANKGITFENYAGSNLKEFLGFSDVKNITTKGVYRFATLADLRTKLNTINTLASTTQGRGVDFRAFSALNTLTVKSDAAGVVEVCDAFIGDGTALGQRSVFIPSHDNNLSVGDFVKIANTAGISAPAGVSFGDGEYMVTSATSNGFWVVAQGVTNAAAPYYAPITAASTSPFTWQKVAGQLGGSAGAQVNLAGPSITIGAGGLGASTTIIIADVGLSAAGYGTSLGASDVVYISGISGGASGNIPAGYYVVSAIGGGGSQATLYAANNFSGASVTGGGPANFGALSIQKIGTVAASAAVNTLDSIPIASVVAAGGVSTATITMSVPHSGYTVGDKISLGGLSAGVSLGLGTSNQAILDPSQIYTISGVSGNTVTFTVNATAAIGALGVSNVGYGSSFGALTGLYINNMTKFFSEMTIDAGHFLEDSAAPITQIAALKSTYNANDSSKNMTNGKIPSDRVATKTVNVYDSLGVLHSLNLAFSKLEPNKWAVEIYSKPNSDGQYEMEVSSPGTPIVAGQITFDENGGVLVVDPSLKQAIPITWKNKSAASSITINWGDATKSGVTQLEGPKDDRILKADGYGSGLLVGVSVTEEGYVVAKFNNGQTVNVYKIPVATFANLDGLTQLSGSIYTQTSESGTALLKEAGRGNIALITSGALTSSNVDVTSELVSSMSFVQQYQAQTNVVSSQQKALDALLRATA